MQPTLNDSIKRVYCLYKVSTIGQVDKNDIPLQKNSCREFAKHQPGCGFEHDIKCGNITINGGNITATGGNGSAGIGCGHSRSTNTSCGDITINGGTVTAIGGELAAGIGCGYDGNCGNITINNTVTQVTAISGGDQYYAIGIGSVGSCGTVTIGGVIKVIRQPSYTYRPE